MTSIAVMSADLLDKLKIADMAWHTAKQEVVDTAEWRRETVREARAAGHSLKEIAEVLGISVAAVSNLERDRGVQQSVARKKSRREQD